MELYFRRDGVWFSMLLVLFSLTGCLGPGRGALSGDLIESSEPIRSQLYPDDWKPGYSVQTDAGPLGLQDFSYAGYRQGEQNLPNGEGFTVLTFAGIGDGSLDVALDLQSFIDQAAASGQPTIIEVPPGLYRLDHSIRVQGKSLVLRGAGADLTRFYLSTPSVSIVLGSEKPKLENQSNWQVTRDPMIGDRFVELKDASGLEVGQDISLTWILTEEFAVENHSAEFWQAGGRVAKTVENFRRTILGKKGNRISFDAPIRFELKTRDSLSVRRISGLTTESGLEGFAVSSALDSIDAAWQAFPGTFGTAAIKVQWAKDSWVRDVKSFAMLGKEEHLLSHGIQIDRSYQITLDRIFMQKAQNLGVGGNGYLFILSNSNEVLVRDCRAEQGRHGLTFLGAVSNSGNVILRLASTKGRTCSSLEAQKSDQCSIGPVDTHEPLAIANLFDNLFIADALQVGNRREASNSAGQTGTLNVMWATRGPGSVYSYNVGQGYVVGSDLDTKVYTLVDPKIKATERLSQDNLPADWSEHIGMGSRLQPQSLYEDQLKRRLAK